MWPETDRREETRISIELPVRVDGGESFGATSRDLSAGGMRLEIGRELPIARELGIAIELSERGEELSVRGKVKWCKRVGVKSENRWLVGVMFTDLEDEMRRRLDSLLEAQRD